MCLYGLSDSNLSTLFKILKVNGLAVSAIIKPGSDDFGHVLLTRKKATDKESGILTSEQVCGWHHKHIVTPIINDVWVNSAGER